jgi:hypothetical protein
MTDIIPNNQRRQNTEYNSVHPGLKIGKQHFIYSMITWVSIMLRMNKKGMGST